MKRKQTLDDKLKDFAFWQKVAGNDVRVSPFEYRDGCGGCGCGCDGGGKDETPSYDGGGKEETPTTSPPDSGGSGGCIFWGVFCSVLLLVGYLHEETRTKWLKEYKECCSHASAAYIIPSLLTSSLPMIIKNPSNRLNRFIQNYQQTISSGINQMIGVPFKCRFTPSCSEYALEAIEKYGTLKGTAMAVYRLLRCNPFSKGGYDPVR